MESTRQQKVAKLIQKELGDIFQRQAGSLFGGAFFTLTKVQVSPDLSIARVYLSFMLAPNKGELLESLNVHKKAIRKSLGERIRKQVRIIPELQFFADENLDYASKMDEIFSKLKIPPAKKDEEKEDE
jgi:ribosome-binding factor A